MTMMWPAIVFGVVAIVGGAVVIKARKSLTTAIAEGQRVFLGRFGEVVARQTRPSGVVIAGIGFILVGIGGILMGLLVPPDAW